MYRIKVFVFLYIFSSFIAAQSVNIFTNTTFTENEKLDSILVYTRDFLTKTYNYDSALIYCNYGLSLTREDSTRSKVGKLFSYKGIAYLRQSDNKMAVEMLDSAISIYTAINYKKGLAICYGNKGKAYFNLGNFDEAEVAYLKNIEISREIKRYKGITQGYNNIGVLYKNRGDFIKAIEYYEKALPIAIENDFKLDHASTLENIGICYSEIGNYELSNSYYKQALKIKEETKNIPYIINTKINLGHNYSQMGDKDSALVIYTEALNSAREAGSKLQLAVLYLNISTIYSSRGNLQQSLEYAGQALKINKEMKRYKGIVSCNVNIAKTYMKLNRLRLARQSLDKALALVDENNLPLLKPDVLNTISELAVLGNDYKAALDYKVLAHAAEDSVINADVKKKIEELNIKYETVKKEKQLLVDKQTINDQKKDLEYRRNLTIVISIVLVSITIFLVFVIVLYYQKRNAFRVLVHQNILLAQKEKKEKNIPGEETKEKYSGSSLTEPRKEEILIELSRLMQDEEIFSNTRLTIEDVAEKLDTNRRYLSQLINETFSSNFSNYLNEYRVKKARQLLLENKFDNYTIEAIGLEVGFHSRAVFNTAFKKFTGVTPSFFRSNRDV